MLITGYGLVLASPSNWQRVNLINMKNIKLFQMPKCLSACLSVFANVCLSDSCTDKRLARTRNMLGAKERNEVRQKEGKAVQWGVCCGTVVRCCIILQLLYNKSQLIVLRSRSWSCSCCCYCCRGITALKYATKLCSKRKINSRSQHRTEHSAALCCHLPLAKGACSQIGNHSNNNDVAN